MKKLIIFFIGLAFFNSYAQLDETTVMGIPTGTTDQINGVTPLEEGAIVYNSQTKELMVFDGTSWADITSSGTGKSLFSVTTTSATGNYSYTPANTNNFIKMDGALAQTSIAVESGDIVDVRVHISEDFLDTTRFNDSYNDIGDVIRSYVTINGSLIGNSMIETLMTGGDNKYEVAAASLNQMFTVSETGTMVIGLEIKFADGITRSFSTSQSGVGGLQAIIYR